MDKDRDISDREERLDEVLAAYLQAAERQEQSLQDWLSRYPEFSVELAAFVHDYRQADAAFKDVGSPPGITPHVILGDDYEIIEQIGSGGMGIVYKALQRSLDRTVAVKTIRAGRLATSEEVARFYKEARAAARLKHPNIVTVYEIRHSKGQYFFSMEYVEGHSLSYALRNGPLDPVQAASYLARVANAVQYAHDSKILHRDLKPSNILLDLSGQPKITDFGLAKVVGQDTKLTGSGAVLGTPSYMSPEQAAGRHSAVGPCSDVYSLGATLYESITGVPPFRGQSRAEILLQISEFEPDPPRTINPNAPVDLETICLRSMDKRPDKRYGSAREFADDLQRFIDGEPIYARPITYPEHAWRFIRRRVTLSSAGLVSGVIAALLIPLLSGIRPVAGIIVLMVIWWVTEAVPAAATALLPLILFPLTGVLPLSVVAANYVDDSVFLFLGGILIAIGLEESGLSRRFALNTIFRISQNPQTVVLALMLATAGISMWLSNTASAILMLPIAFGVISQIQTEDVDENTINFRKALMLGIAYAAGIGGMTTPVGTPANQKFLEHFNAVTRGSAEFGFLRWMSVGIPCAIALLVAGWSLLVYRTFPLSRRDFFAGKKKIISDLEAMGPSSAQEKRMMVIAIITAWLWVFRNPIAGFGWAPAIGLGNITDGMVALAMALLCFIVPSGKESGQRLLQGGAMTRVPWDVFLLFGGGLALAKGITASGLDLDLGRALAGHILPQFGIVTTLAAAGTAAAVTQLTTNLATTEMLLPILAETAQRLGINSESLLLAATLAASCAFTLPISTPPNAIVFSAGRLTVRDMLRAGIWLTLVGVAVIAFFVTLLIN